MTPQAQVHAALARLARRSPLWRAAIPLIHVQVTRQTRTTATVGNNLRINPQYAAGMAADDLDTLLAHTLGGIASIRDILAAEQRA